MFASARRVEMHRQRERARNTCPRPDMENQLAESVESYSIETLTLDHGFEEQFIYKVKWDNKNYKIQGSSERLSSLSAKVVAKTGAQGELTLSYRDTKGDYIALDGDDSLAQAVQEARDAGQKVLKLVLRKSLLSTWDDALRGRKSSWAMIGLGALVVISIGVTVLLRPRKV